MRLKCRTGSAEELLRFLEEAFLHGAGRSLADGLGEGFQHRFLLSGEPGGHGDLHMHVEVAMTLLTEGLHPLPSQAESGVVLGASGHIAGVINPASKNKRNFWVGKGELPENPEAWFKSAKETAGSWWTDWAQWLEPMKGGLVKAPAKLGNATFKPIEAAPGRYVKQRV